LRTHVYKKKNVVFHPEYVKKMKDIIRQLTGKTPKFRKANLDALAQRAYEYQEYMKKWMIVNPDNLTSKQKKRHILDAQSEILYYLSGKRVSEPLEFMTEKITSHLKDPDGEGILSKKSKLRFYYLYLSKIAQLIISSGQEKKIRAYFSHASKTDMIILFQHGYELPKKSEMVLKEYKNITKTVLEKHLELYKTLSEYMEKMVFQLYSILKILNGQNIIYKDVINNPLSCNYNYLQRDRNFRLLIKPLDVLIRNSLAHRQRYFTTSNTIVFKDSKNARRRKKVSFRKFLIMTRELCISAYLTSHLEDFLNVYKLNTMKKQLRFM